MKLNYIFYHMYCANNCLDLFDSTFKKILTSGLIDQIETLFVNLVGENVDTYINAECLKHPKIKISTNTVDFSGEMATIKLLWNFCQDNDVTNVLYLHSKGASRSHNSGIKAWVDYMEYFAIEKWEDCFNALKEKDTCGVNLSTYPGKHYSGNFWWATGDYIKRHKQFDTSTCFVPGYSHDPRAYCEFWLLDNDFHNAHSLWNSDVDHYGVIYEEETYRNK